MCWNYKYIILILFTTLVDYAVGLLIPQAKSRKLKKLYLLMSIFANLGMLFFFKYINFFSSNLNSIFESYNVFRGMPVFSFLLPVGISFYTFQSLSYTIDVYKGKKEPERHLGIFACYVAFFPQLVAGPIERSTSLLPQFYKAHRFEYQRIRNGIILIVWGLFKKVAIADRLAEYVNIVYSDPSGFSGLQEILATFFFTFQIYCDFSGYSDIAIGTAMILGFQLMTNFRRPYFAQSIREFWQRWHISLSTWFRDYIYISLGGNRVVKWRWYYNLLITFLISGFWHGANWTFIIWGSLHGIYIILGYVTSRWREKAAGWIGLSSKSRTGYLINLAWTFSLVGIGWIFFRANNIYDVREIFVNILDFSSYNLNLQLFHFPADFYLSFMLIGFLLIVEAGQEKFSLVQKLSFQPRMVKWAMMITILISIFILGKWNEVDFIYFQF
jgi:D-alanyl-lipoteichoic acid acyltransferase DltB (MBOAT superfamily)